MKLIRKERFEIAGLTVDAHLENHQVAPKDVHIFEKFVQFYSDSTGKPDIELFIKSVDSLSKLSGKVILQEDIVWFCEDAKKDRISVCVPEKKKNRIISQLVSENCWSTSYIEYLSGKYDNDYALMATLGEIIFRNCVLFHQGIVLHASALDWNGKGVVFSAPAGTGKTTQSDLWKRLMDAKVLNGDRPTIRTIREQAYVYGTPWCGSSPDFVNGYAPLSIIVLLEQAAENRIFRLQKQEALLRLMPRCFLPYYDKEHMNKAINNLENILEKTPVYLLSCRPDREAVELVYQCIK